MGQKQILNDALEHFGPTNQMIKCIEELGELTQVLCKFINKEWIKISADEVLQEMADVQIMLDQMKIRFGEFEFDRAHKNKLNRLEERLKDL